MVDQMYSNYPANKIMTLVAGDTFWVIMVVLDLCVHQPVAENTYHLPFYQGCHERIKLRGST